MTAITRRGAMLASVAAVAGVPMAVAAQTADPKEEQALALFRQLNSHRQGISLMAMRAFLDVQRHNESNGWTEEPPRSAYPWGARP